MVFVFWKIFRGHFSRTYVNAFKPFNHFVPFKRFAPFKPSKKRDSRFTFLASRSVAIFSENGLNI